MKPLRVCIAVLALLVLAAAALTSLQATTRAAWPSVASGQEVLPGSIDTRDTRLLANPAVSRNNLAFVYAGDLWVAGADGAYARRLQHARRELAGHAPEVRGVPAAPLHA